MAVLKSIITAFITLAVYSSLVSAAPEGTFNTTRNAVATFTKGVNGTITFQGYYDEKTKKESTLITVDIQSGLDIPAEGYPYHVHVKPITGDNCTTAGGHLDPKNITDLFVCKPPNLAECQPGDLSGKYGKLIADNGKNKTTAVDEYLSWTNPDYTLLNRSVVIHYPNSEFF
ncbi:13066_t:CDS:2 [Ambispora gerdemannii]|uniref:13066_t:CDS:1 n=1 Tax=Ambispora gerdemannii TaxID=144530 RepID=A0A9N9GHY3_9GLOM|nr:13066_t:CDS:2 [Ambispora gerdemannii]